MSYVAGAALQSALYSLLTHDSAVDALVGTNIFDEMPHGDIPDGFLVIGVKEARDRSDATGGMAEHRASVSVVSHAEGFLEAKELAAAVTDALDGARPLLSRGRVVCSRFLRARARRTRAAQTRRIDLTFSVLVADE